MYIWVIKFSTQISSIIVALVFLYALNFKSIVTFHYFINQAEITELFCVNKEKPELQCNGKCHLVKELVKVEPQNESTPFSENTIEYNLELIFDVVKNEEIALNTTSLHRNWGQVNEQLISRNIEILSPPPKG